MSHLPKARNRQQATDEEVLRMKVVMDRKRRERALAIAQSASKLQCAQSDPFFVRRMYSRIDSGLAQDLSQAIGTD